MRPAVGVGKTASGTGAVGIVGAAAVLDGGVMGLKLVAGEVVMLDRALLMSIDGVMLAGGVVAVPVE